MLHRSAGSFLTGVSALPGLLLVSSSCKEGQILMLLIFFHCDYRSCITHQLLSGKAWDFKCSTVGKNLVWFFFFLKSRCTFSNIYLSLYFETVIKCN